MRGCSCPQTHIRVYTDLSLYGQGESTDAAFGIMSLIHSWCSILFGRDTLYAEAECIGAEIDVQVARKAQMPGTMRFDAEKVVMISTRFSPF